MKGALDEGAGELRRRKEKEGERQKAEQLERTRFTVTRWNSVRATESLSLQFKLQSYHILLPKRSHGGVGKLKTQRNASSRPALRRREGLPQLHLHLLLLALPSLLPLTLLPPVHLGNVDARRRRGGRRTRILEQQRVLAVELRRGGARHHEGRHLGYASATRRRSQPNTEGAGRHGVLMFGGAEGYGGQGEGRRR